uniref:PAS domain-containing sensor histidine kinase n=1 Tax=uncultured Draconibacterium sp. TaxID=1573823 RepID=UPI0032179A97
MTQTSFSPVARFSKEQLEKQAGFIHNNQQLINLIESISQMVLILNEHRQIIYANQSFYQLLDENCIPSIIGKRPGEVFQCKNAVQPETGCDIASSGCKSCGALNAILESQKGKSTTRECNILTTDNNAIDLSVKASPLHLDGLNLTIYSITDISSEKRKESLECIFIHDILNIAGGISGLSSLLKDINDKKEIVKVASIIESAAKNLIEEIKTQREIGAAERGDLVPDVREINSLQLIKELAAIYSKHTKNPGKNITINPQSTELTLMTDPVLLKRILGNMIKNAFETNTPNDKITLSCESRNQFTCFSVNNKSYIPEPVLVNLFKRFYSTKGNGRGLGTYSMKLFGEKYLNGKIGVESSEEKGTTFYILL